MQGYLEALANLPVKTEIIHAGDDRIETFCEDTMYRGAPDAVLVASSEDEVSCAMKFASGCDLPVTICGSQTSMTGSSVADSGLTISTQKLCGIVDINKNGDCATVTVRPGTIVSDLQDAVAREGFFFPVAPTSRDECTIGANVATNATGEDSYKYGPIRPYVAEVDLILPSGEKKTLARSPNANPSFERNKAGYFMGWIDPIDLVIGSEGTLGFVSRITLKLLPAAPPFVTMLIPFGSNLEALDFVVDVATAKKNFDARAIELIDKGALNAMKTANGFPKMKDDVDSLLYIKQEYTSQEELGGLLEKWYEHHLARAGQSFADRIIIADTPQKQNEFRLWRHRIPESENEKGRELWSAGGGKIGSDWWVPVSRLKEMMAYFYEVATASGLSYIAYAHIGAGHPHTNLMARNKAEKEIAHKVLRACCKKAAELGGGAAGEHGLGKIHRDLLSLQHGAAVIELMKSWKLEYDPKWILGQGNIFER